MNLQLTDKIAIITGGTRGIGAGIARVLAAEGVHLALAYRSDTEGALRFTRELHGTIWHTGPRHQSRRHYSGRSGGFLPKGARPLSHLPYPDQQRSRRHAGKYADGGAFL